MTVELLERIYRLQAFTSEWLMNPKSSDYQPLHTTQHEWTIIMYVLEVLTPFWYCTLWMSKRHMVPLHHVITVHNEIFDHMDGVMSASDKKMTEWNED
jgi:hypothetical protein